MLRVDACQPHAGDRQCKQCLPCCAQSYEADWELLELLAGYLPQRFPNRFTLQGSLLTNHSTGDAWDLSDRSQDAMEISALLVQASILALAACPCPALAPLCRRIV